MATILSTMLGWFGWGGAALGERAGVQQAVPAASVVTGAAIQGPDNALQIDTVWACLDRRATTLASLPIMVYEQDGAGQKRLARVSRLWSLLHDSPNNRMTPFDFWRVMMLNHDLRGNAYARIDRDERTGEAVSLWPMPADQVQPSVLDDGSMVYVYRVDDDIAVLDEANVLHLRNLGNGTVGMDKLAFMRAGVNEAVSQVNSAATMWGSSGKPTGVLMLDRVLKPEQRTALLERFAGMAAGNTARLYLLEADMKYQAVSLTPEQQQLLESRKLSVEQFCRWYDVPPVLVHHANVTTWGSGIEQIVEGFVKFTVRPLAVGIEQALRKRVLTPAQRARMVCEVYMDALLRASLKDRMTIYSAAVQNGVYTRNECRQFENVPRDLSPLADALTVQTNLIPIGLLGQATATTGAANAATQAPVAQ